MRFVELAPERCAVVYSELGRVRWVKKSPSFTAWISRAVPSSPRRRRSTTSTVVRSTRRVGSSRPRRGCHTGVEPRECFSGVMVSRRTRMANEPREVPMRQADGGQASRSRESPLIAADAVPRHTSRDEPHRRAHAPDAPRMKRAFERRVRAECSGPRSRMVDPTPRTILSATFSAPRSFKSFIVRLSPWWHAASAAGPMRPRRPVGTVRTSS
jgi:hypothetical protein